MSATGDFVFGSSSHKSHNERWPFVGKVNELGVWLNKEAGRPIQKPGPVAPSSSLEHLVLSAVVCVMSEKFHQVSPHIKAAHVAPYDKVHEQWKFACRSGTCSWKWDCKPRNRNRDEFARKVWGCMISSFL